jgi:hypothetical protein
VECIVKIFVKTLATSFVAIALLLIPQKALLGFESEDAVKKALEWLSRHQSEDGAWKCADFVKECKATCKNINSAGYGEGRGSREHDVAVTGLAMLAFTEHAGHTHLGGPNKKYVQCLAKAVKYLKEVQEHSEDPKSNGRYGPVAGNEWIYDHAIATFAMATLLVQMPLGSSHP